MKSAVDLNEPYLLSLLQTTRRLWKRLSGGGKPDHIHYRDGGGGIPGGARLLMQGVFQDENMQYFALRRKMSKMSVEVFTLKVDMLGAWKAAPMSQGSSVVMNPVDVF